MKLEEMAKAYASFYENLHTNTSYEEYGVFFTETSEFEDPFQKVQGREEIVAIFSKMYEKLHNPRFVVDEIVCSNDVAYLRWDFFYALTQDGEVSSFRGVSRVTCTEDGKIKSHIDYWDAAKHVYENIPLLGSLMRFVKRKVHGK